ncbi:Tudor/PWWP/MBT superfamily protein [Corchorus olitorius]|uniref:Tudor/PWWP/MBT superfamily protein n=1 Tax=Corchorus olitorius TaxID=93759 RepID=A0A1R3HGZ4_9ROSI|nr:Tudor/PWWP/MBT superfamily protein [Corchorus olitorius]
MEAFEKPTKTQNEDRSLDHDGKPLNEDSKSVVAADFTVEKPLGENGVRVSVNGKEGGACGDGEDGEGLEDSEMNGVSSLLQMKESMRKVDVNGGNESVEEGFGSLLGAVDESKEIGDKDVLASADDGVALMADTHGETREIDEEERRDLDDKENGGDGGTTRKLNEIDDDDDDDSDGDWGGEFSAGDFVWGKIKSHPWWPGQVYDPSDASDYAVKVRQKGRFLVAYFGDSSFAWCHPSQLKPFEENFEEMSKLSSSKNFLNAVQTSVDEIGRLLELKMTCFCVPKENCIGRDRPLAANAGIKKGALVPEGGIGKLSIGVLEPKEVLDKLKHIAEAVSMSNILECTVLKGWLSAFYRSNGGRQMPMYHEPLSISELEENVSSLVVDMSDYNEAVEVPIAGPIEKDWVSLSGIKFGLRSHSLLRCPEISEDGMSHRRKEKSIAEILKGEVDGQVRKDEDVEPKGTISGEQASFSRRKKTKANDKASGDDGSNISSITWKRKGTQLSRSLEARKGKLSSAEADGSGAKEELGKGYSSRGRKKKSEGASNAADDSGGKDEEDNHPVPAKRKLNVGSGVGNSDAEAKDLSESGSLLRERKKSKYLSPPYTSPPGKLSRMDFVVESLKASNESQLGEQMTKATGNLVSSPLVGESNRLAEEVNTKHKASNESSLYTAKRYQNRMIDLAKVIPPAPEVLIEVQSVALSPQYPRINKSFEIVVEFLSVFRSSVYRDEANYENQLRSHRKRKTPDSVTESSGKDQNLTDNVPSSGHKSKKKKAAKDEETKMDQFKPRQATRASPKKVSEESKARNTKIKQAARAAAARKKDNEVENASSALFVTFGPGSSLPTKDDLVKLYSKYGALNMEDTDMFYNNFCARVVFLRSSDAERAFKSSQMASPFKSDNVSFRLRYHPAASAHEQRQTPRAKPSPLAKKRAKSPKKSVASQNSADQASQLNFIRDKLEMLSSMLETSDEKMISEMKPKLQGELQGLLKKVNTMVESSS